MWSISFEFGVQSTARGLAHIDSIYKDTNWGLLEAAICCCKKPDIMKQLDKGYRITRYQDPQTYKYIQHISTKKLNREGKSCVWKMQDSTMQTWDKFNIAEAWKDTLAVKIDMPYTPFTICSSQNLKDWTIGKTGRKHMYASYIDGYRAKTCKHANPSCCINMCACVRVWYQHTHAIQ